jgi:prepilin-type N-terminal cleavage/methylation domain-containing protein
MRNFKGNKKGFTLAEMALTAAMVGIMGAAAATATTNTAGEARQVMLESLADILSKASQMNQNDMNDDATSGRNIKFCADTRVLVEGGKLPGNYAFLGADATVEMGALDDDGVAALTTVCTISTTTNPPQTAEFITFGVSNGLPGLDVDASE